MVDVSLVIWLSAGEKSAERNQVAEKYDNEPQWLDLAFFDKCRSLVDTYF